MESIIPSNWHFPFMIIASFIVFFFVIRIVIGKKALTEKKKLAFFLAIFIVIIGMGLGKYGFRFGIPWWIYYPVPLLMNLILPPVVLKMDKKQTGFYLLLSLFSAPFIHIFFSFLLGWKEYMPFWNIPSLAELMTK